MQCPTFTTARGECVEGEAGGAKDDDELRAERVCDIGHTSTCARWSHPRDLTKVFA